MSPHFWKRLKDWAEHHRHEAWMRRHRFDSSCPNCKMWFGESGTWDTGRAKSFDPDASVIDCANCGKRSVWDHRYMLPIVAEDQALIRRALSL